MVGYELYGIKGTRDAVTEPLNTGCIRMEEDRGIVMEAEGWIALTLRRLMSYIYMEHPFLMFLDHTQRRSTVGRTPLDE